MLIPTKFWFYGPKIPLDSVSKEWYFVIMFKNLKETDLNILTSQKMFWTEYLHHNII